MTTATDMLQKYIDAETAILQGQTVRFSTGSGDRLLTRANLAEVQAGRREWSRIVDRETAANLATSAGNSLSSARYSTPDFS